ncbi:MAG: T9SS type A sorting domain-containing protein, partial [Paludibacteraceae bacterium]|nr:T9SS type A sorting domain-containing protein [Paludibacteraceae bacterium]
CLGVNNEYNTISWVQIPIDWDPNPNKEVYNRDSKKYVEIVKYTETFRIKPKVEGSGRIVLQDSFVRFGGSAVIEVIPAAGSRIDSVVTSRGEILTSENGLFKIENVTDVVGVTAYFSNATGVETYESDRMEISPNPTTGEIRVKGKKNFDYEILDMQGKLQWQGHSENGVLDVSGLSSGHYLLRVGGYTITFQKR